MATDIYEKLAKHLDNLPAGFPRTESGVEMRILRRIFTPEDAEFAMHLTLIPEEPRVIARRAKIAVKEAAGQLEEMEKKGLIGAVRAVVELVGAHNVIAKTLGRGNPFNTVRATLDGLTQLRNPEDVLRLRRQASAAQQEGATI